METASIKSNLGDGELVDFLGYEVFSDYYKNCEPQTKRWLLRNLQSDSWFVDVGANIGILSRTALKIIKSGSVIAIEPTETSRLLSKNLSGFENVILINDALANFDGSGSASLQKVYNREVEEREFKFRTLDSICSEMNLPRIDVVKIDTDGWELEILEGSVDVISRFHPAIIIELNEGLLVNQHTFQEVFNFFVKYGYTHAFICDGANFIFTHDASAKKLDTPNICFQSDIEPFTKSLLYGRKLDSLEVQILEEASSVSHQTGKVFSFKAHNPRWSYNCSVISSQFLGESVIIKITGRVIQGKLGILATTNDGSTAISEELYPDNGIAFIADLEVENWDGRLAFRNVGISPIEACVDSIEFYELVRN